MRWTGIIVLAFLFFHLADLTWGWFNPDYVYGDVYGNVVASFERVPVAILYIVGNLALGVHLYHGGVEHLPEPRLEQPPLQRRGAAGSRRPSPPSS